MPPKPKFTKEEIVVIALELVSAGGMEALTARELGARMGSSARPIFTVFRDMEELKTAVAEAARARFRTYMAVAEQYTPAYKKRGMQWVLFAKEEPQLFRLLFMQHTDRVPGFAEMRRVTNFDCENDIAIITRDYHASMEQAEHLFRQMWIYAYGLCVLCATGVCAFSDAEIAQQLGEIFAGMIFVLRSGGTLVTKLQPAARDSAEGAWIRSEHPDLRSSEPPNKT